MSLILEALQKSEHERTLGQIPGLDATVVLQTHTAARRWKLLALSLIAANVVGAAVYLIGQRGQSDDVFSQMHMVAPVPAVPTDAGPRVADPAPAPLAALSDIDAVHRYEQVRLPRVAPARAEPAAQPLQSELSEMRLRESQPTVEALPQTLAPEQAGSETQPVPVALEATDVELPSFEQIRSGALSALAPLRLDVHVYSAQSHERFVFINMNKYHEGEQIREGPRVADIRNNGVVLEYQGQRFLLTAQQ